MPLRKAKKKWLIIQMSQRFVSLCLFISLGLNFYLVWERGESKPLSDNVKIGQSALKLEKSYIPKARHKNNVKFIEEEILPEKKSEPSQNIKTENEAFDGYRDQEEIGKALEKRDKEVRSFMERDLGLAPEVASLYFELSDRRQQEIDAYLAPKINPDGSDSYEPYFFTIDDGIEIARINSKYVNLLKSAMGVENYQNFTKYRNSFNRKIMEEGGEHSFWIEF